MSNYGDSASYPQGAKPRTAETSPERIRVARREARLYVATLADWVQGGFMPMADAEREITVFFAELADTYHLNAAEFEAARDAEWSEANRAALQRVEAIRRVTRKLAWQGAPLAAITAGAVAEADRLKANFGNSQLESLIADTVKPIAQTLARRARS